MTTLIRQAFYCTPLHKNGRAVGAPLRNKVILSYAGYQMT